MPDQAEELKCIDREIEEDFERTDRDILEAENYEPQGWEKWDWVLWGLLCIILGLCIFIIALSSGDSLAIPEWYMLVVGAAFLGCGTLSLIFRDTIFPLP